MISHCGAFRAGVIIRLIVSEFGHQQDELAFRVYVTDTLRILTENTARIAGGSIVKVNYSDIIGKRYKRAEKQKSGEEIVADIIARAGLEIA